METKLLHKFSDSIMFHFSAIDERLDAVTEVRDSPPPVISKLQGVIRVLPDLERGLCTIFHKKVLEQYLWTATGTIPDVKTVS